MNAQMVTITPQFADELLKKNVHNRPLNEKHVKRLMGELTGGRWKVNGSTICVNGTRLIDGQHRLEACRRTGIPFPTLLVEGLDSGVFDTIDCGRIRRAGDTLALMGEKNGVALAATLQFIERYMTKKVDVCTRYSNSEMEEFIEKYSGARHSVAYCLPLKTRLIPFSVMAGLHYLFSQTDPERANRVMVQVSKGADLRAGDPIHTLRERLLKNAVSAAKLRAPLLAALFVKAWNRARKGKTMSHLTHGEHEPFPVIQ